MKKVWITVFAVFSTIGLLAQDVSLGNTGGFNGWFRLGVLSLQQHGADAYIQIASGGGYNSNVGQNGECHIHFRTSNAVSETNGVYASGSFYSTGITKILSSIRVVQINQSTWEFYAVMPSFTGQEALFSLRSVSGTWQSSFYKLDPPTQFPAFDLTEEFLVTSNVYMMGDVGIGTSTPREKLSVNGNIRAKEIKVEAEGWPDYVFEEKYKLMDLGELKSFIKKHNHLPDMPSASEVVKDGIAVGEMNKKLLQKIEEFTLYLLEKNEELVMQKQKIKDLEEGQSQLKKMLKDLTEIKIDR
ncbi:hypothetical protein EA772_01310 [Pedobacter sp. G11]|uniref:hypothetical protein n=1 Tax=Pedobacter sp. G11 TaxID=2482728 RepID=UPI000F5D83DB|nr:hypothetical protein [Pedobacter sp. G11]AZI24046.1 hypothetical protein EA772_01310 [Pedobacter sp. G11]